MSRRILVACCSPVQDPDWRWIAGSLDGDRFAWRFFNTRPQNFWERAIRRPHVARLRACWETARSAARENADLIVSHQPLVSCWTEIFRRRSRVDCPHVAFSFNFTRLPAGWRRKLMTRAFQTVDRFVVFSEHEKEVYSRFFRLPAENFDVIPWGVREPDEDGDAPRLEADDYIVAVGSQGRDYATLLEAMRRLPSIRLTLVAKPENLGSLPIPGNVRVRLNAPIADVYNLMRHARLMVLPLEGEDVACGHVTLVTAMYLNLAIVATDSRGIADYVKEGTNALLCPPRQPDVLAARIQELWDNAALGRSLAEAGRAFAIENCTESHTVRQFERIAGQLVGA